MVTQRTEFEGFCPAKWALVVAEQQLPPSADKHRNASRRTEDSLGLSNWRIITVREQSIPGERPPASADNVWSAHLIDQLSLTAFLCRQCDLASCLEMR